MACGAPEDEAPELFALLEGENFDTYFVRQPVSPAEIERACKAAEACCVNAVRYGGRDRMVIARLGNSPSLCDNVVAWWGGTVYACPAPKWWQFWRRGAAAT
jgi:hypothetical protein